MCHVLHDKKNKCSTSNRLTFSHVNREIWKHFLRLATYSFQSNYSDHHLLHPPIVYYFIIISPGRINRFSSIICYTILQLGSLSSARASQPTSFMQIKYNLMMAFLLSLFPTLQLNLLPYTLSSISFFVFSISFLNDHFGYVCRFFFLCDFLMC